MSENLQFMEFHWEFACILEHSKYLCTYALMSTTFAGVAVFLHDRYVCV